MVSSEVNAKKPRVSKNKKRNWRKHSNINDVEEFLEDQRFEERIGGPTSEKTDESLFFVHKDPDIDIKPQKKKCLLENLQCFAILKNSSKVAPPVQPSCPQSTIRKTYQKKNKKNKKDAQPKKTNKKKSDFYDIWNSNETSVPKVDLDDELVDYIDEVTKKKPPKVPVHRYQKPSLLPAVELPLPGTSYNPQYKDHQHLLLEVTKTELKYEKECKKLERALTEKFPTIDEAPTQQTWFQEMSQGLDSRKEETEENETEKDPDSLSAPNPPVHFDNKKSKQKRKREKEIKEKLKEKKEEKLKNKRINEIYRLRNIKKEITHLEEKIESRKNQKDERIIKQMYGPKTLSKHKYEELDFEFNLPEELTGELRTIKTVGNIMEDRYKSLQRRNIIEPRIRQKMKRKYKLKIFTRKSHKDINEQICKNKH